MKFLKFLNIKNIFTIIINEIRISTKDFSICTTYKFTEKKKNVLRIEFKKMRNFSIFSQRNRKKRIKMNYKCFQFSRKIFE